MRMSTKKKDSTLKMKTLSECANKAFDQGYTENFKIINKRISTTETEPGYGPTEISIHSTFRFEGYSDPQDTSILYLIKTQDGKRGTLIDASGVYADASISAFIAQVTDIQKNQTP